MHACNAVTLAQLLSVRDGEPVEAGAQRHVEQCASCARELIRLREVQGALRALPLANAPKYDPARMRSRLQRPQMFRVAAIASAASVGALVAILMFVQGGTRDFDATLATTASTTVANDAPAPDVDSWVIRSQELESYLQRLPQRPRVERAGTSLTIDSLQDRIQWVDYQLSLADEVGMTDRQAAQLWQDRVQLMDSLVKVRYAEAQRTAYFMPISGSSL